MSIKKQLSASVLNKELSVTGAPSTMRIKDFSDQNLVLYFYPKDSTPGCTKEGHDFTKLHKKFQSRNTQVFGVSADSIPSHERFKEKQKYSFELISDPDKELCKAFGILKTKTLFGKKIPLGIERSTFVINKQGQIAKEWRKVQVKGHADEVLQFIQTL